MTFANLETTILAIKALERTQEFYRLFMVPGGSVSNAPTTFEPVPYLERWVEQGIPPKRIFASRSSNGVVDRTRPLCPYPPRLRYTEVVAAVTTRCAAGDSKPTCNRGEFFKEDCPTTMES
jgi:Tannase and feruloyl esterase